MDRRLILRVAATAADVFLHLRHHFRFGGGGILLQRPDHADDHAGRAITALECVLRQKRLLHRMQLVAVRQPLNRHHLLLVHVADGCDAGSLAHTVDQHRAGAALPLAAAELRPGQLQILAQHFEQRPVRIGGDGPGFPVQGEADFGVHKRRVKVGSLVRLQ